MGARRSRVVAGVAALTLVASCGFARPDPVDASDASTSAGAPVEPGSSSAAPAATPTNVVLMIGDGLGAGAREATRLTTVGRDGRLAMDALRYAGWVRTDPADPGSLVTDSAAAATAFAAGVRTRNGSVGVDRRGRPVESLLDHARRLGKATGLVTTSEVTDATPAAFGAHVAQRGRHREIARQYVRDSRPDVVLGGGADRWPARLRDRARAAGWELVTSGRGLDRARGPRIIGLFAERRMFVRGVEGRGRYAPRPSLRSMTAKALDVLSADPDGFFLLVEEEAVDEMAHVNNAELTIAATRAFDRTVALVHRFARRHPGTLVVVVGDHETGGMAVEKRVAGDDGGDADGPFAVVGSRLELYVDWTGRGHTGAGTPVSAHGPGASRLARTQHATHVHDVLLDVLRGG